MAIDNGRLVVGPTKRRDYERQFYVSYVTNTPPGVVRYYTDQNGSIAFDAQLPEVEGQLVVYQTTSPSTSGQLFVAVSIQETLTWVRVLHTIDMQDSRTGEKWDPLAGFYHPLAS